MQNIKKLSIAVITSFSVLLIGCSSVQSDNGVESYNEDVDNTKELSVDTVVDNDFSEEGNNAYVLPEGYIGIYETSSANWNTSLQSVEENEDGTYTAIWGDITVSDVLAISQEEYDAIQVGDRLPDSILQKADYYSSWQCVEVSDAKYFITDSFSTMEESRHENCDFLRFKESNKMSDGRIPLCGTGFDAGDESYNIRYDNGTYYENAKTIIAADATIRYLKECTFNGGYNSNNEYEEITFKEFYDQDITSAYKDASGLSIDTWRGTGMLYLYGNEFGQIVEIDESPIQG